MSHFGVPHTVNHAASGALRRNGKAAMSRIDRSKSRSAGGKGFYIALALCLAAVGAIWKRYSEDEYKNLALGNGIGGWDGIPELYDFVMKNIENDQYKVMMIVKSLVVKIQNGLTYEEITSAYVNLLDEEDKEHQRILCELIRTLYKTVPLYSLKGHTRTELEEESQEARFHVIQGGKE